MQERKFLAWQGAPSLAGMLSLLCMVSLLVLLPAWSHAKPLQPARSVVSSDNATIAQGERLFARDCAICHGKKAIGEDATRPQGGWHQGVGQVAPALNGTGHAWHHPPAHFFEKIKHGTRVENSRMVGWKGRLTDYEILSVIAYFQSLWPGPILAAYWSRYAE